MTHMCMFRNVGNKLDAARAKASQSMSPLLCLWNTVSNSLGIHITIENY
jgi:hypothetical protein